MKEYADNPTTGEVFEFDEASNQWIPAKPDFVEFADNPDTGERFGFNNASQKWETLPDDFYGNEFTRGVQRGWEGTKSLITEGGAALAKGVANEVMDGIQAVSDFYDGPEFTPERFDPVSNLKQYLHDGEVAARMYPTSTPSYKDVLAKDGVGPTLSAAGDYVAGSLGEAVPSIASSLASGGFGGYVAKKGAEKVAKDMAGDAAKKYIAGRTVAGTTAGAMAGEYAQTAPGAYMNLLEQGENAPGTAMLVGAAQAAVGGMAEARILSKIVGKDVAEDVVSRGLLRRAGTEMGITGGLEGVAEATQEGLDIFAENVLLDKEMFTKENAERMIESGLKGWIGGAGAGVAFTPFTGPIKGRTERKLTKEEADAIFEEVDLGPANIAETAAINPAYTTPEQDAVLDRMGVDKESIVPLDADGVSVSVEKAIGPKPEPKVPDADTKTKVEAGLKERQKGKKAVREGKKDVVVDPTFQPGDGVIQKGGKQSERVNTVPAARKVRTTNPRALERAIAAAKTQAANRNPNQLPRDLQRSAPRMGTAKLKFPSDVEKALYIARTSAAKSKRHEAFRSWLKDVQGYSDAEINEHGNMVHKAIKDIYNADSTAESIDVPSIYDTDEGPKLQKMPDLPFRGNLHDDAVVPQQLADNLFGQELSAAATGANANIIQQIKRIAKEVGSPNLEVKFFSRLSTDPTMSTDPVAAAYWNNAIYVALDRHAMHPTAVESAYHEVAHFLWDKGGFSLQEKQMMINDAPVLKKYIDKDGVLTQMDYDTLMSTHDGREEAVCNAIGKMATEMADAPDHPKGIFTRAANRIRNFINRLRNALRGNGFNSFRDVVKNMQEGTNAIDAALDANYTSKMARLQRLADNTVQTEVAKQEATIDERARTAVRTANEDTRKSGALMGNWGRYFKSIGHLARGNPVAALAFNITKDFMNRKGLLMNSYANAMGSYMSLPKEMRFRIGEIADYVSLTGKKATLTDQGYLTYERDGRKVVIENKELGENYMNLQKAFTQVLNDRLNEATEHERSRFPQYFPADLKNIQLPLIQDAIKKAQVAEDTKAVEALQELAEIHADAAKMKNKDYFPKLRFGSYGFAVHDLEGNEVAFYTIERGDFMGGLYNKYQYEKTIEELKSKYGDNKKYRIKGEGNVKDLSKATPFVLEHNQLRNNISTQYLNLESLAGLLNSKDVDPAAYASVRDALTTDIQTKGFKRHFTEARNIDGYSRDVDRVIHAYFSAAANFIPNATYRQQVAALQTAMLGMVDKDGSTSTKRKLDEYLNYVGSPQEDLQFLRTLNFMWTMGGNLSTAALQAMTLPTFTLGVISQYNPNILANMMYIGSNVKLAASLMKASAMDISLLDGQIAMNIGSTDQLVDFAKKHNMPIAKAMFLNQLNNYGTLRGGMTEENLGHKNFETRSIPGSVKNQITNIGRVAGAPISIMEQMTRFATIMAAYDAYTKNPAAVERARKVLANDYRWQAQLESNPQFTEAENLALYSMDEAHGVFGKVGRVEYQRGVGGAVFFPFMTYPHQMLETVATMMGRGADGRRALGVTMAALFMLAGLMGLPGAEFLKEMTEEIIRVTTGVETDIDLSIREQITKFSGSKEFALAVTQGIGRPLLGLDISRRIGLPLPGQEAMLTTAGIRGDAADLFGVQGSILTGIAGAVNAGMQGDFGANMWGALTPVALSNVIKSFGYNSDGINTQTTGAKLVRPEDVTALTQFARAVGVGSDQVAEAREKVYNVQLMEKRFKTGEDRLRKQGKKLANDVLKYQQWGEDAKAKEALDELNEVRKDYIDFALKNGYPPNIGSFNRSLMEAAVTGRNEDTVLKYVNKNARVPVIERERLLWGRE